MTDNETLSAALNDIRAEIEALLNGSNDLLYDRGIVDCLDVIDRHIKGEGEEDADS